MHLLRSTAIGMEVITDDDHEVVARVRDIVIDPDRGNVVALVLFLYTGPGHYGVQTADIVSWGKRVHISRLGVVGEIDDFVRLENLFDDSRTFVGQKIHTENGVSLGRCSDVQFRSDTFDLEWMYPRKFLFLRGTPLPMSEVIQVLPEAIIVRDQGLTERKEEEEHEIHSGVIPSAAH